MNFILFGPPGVGKSTLIGILKTRGSSALDLEDLYPNKIRFHIPHLVDDTFLGGADLNPQRNYANCVKILLTANQDTYDDRRAARDSDYEGKATQKRHLIGHWLKGASYDYIMDTTNLSAEKTADRLLAIRKEAHQ